MSNKTQVVLIFGGRSAEHEISISSAKNIYSALDKNKYEVDPIYISKSGHWFSGPETLDILTSLPNQKSISTLVPTNPQSLIPNLITNAQSLITPQTVVFPVLHGPFGEDGTIQGWLKLLNIPFVGAGVLGSAIGMDKDVQKRLLQHAHIPVAKFDVITSNQQPAPSNFTYPIFVKPANLGSSVGISKVKNEKELCAAIKKAFQYDSKILIEEYLPGREIEVSVLGNEKPIASLPGEIITNHEFYDYDAKYIDENGAKLKIPAGLPKNLVKQFQQLAIKTFQTLECRGLARVDFFLTKDNKIYVNEINTIPGFTNSSMYPKIWEASGITQGNLLDKLISLALDRFNKERKLKTSK